jgi:type IV pilus assembly protein PilO
VAITLDRIVKLPTSRKILILALIAVIIAGLYVYFLYLPKAEVLKKKVVEMEKLETQVQELRIIAANMKRFQEEAAKLREELKLAIAQLPTTKEIPSLLANISNLGKEAGLDFLLFRPVPEITREFYAEIPVEIKVKGTYNDVAIFFDKVGKMSRIVNIAGVAMEGAKESSGRWDITTSCTATTFKFIEKEASTVEPGKESKPEPKKVPPTKK